MAASLETDVFEHFRILRREDGALWELGHGAMGITFKALDTRLDAFVALKIIGADVLANAAARERFRREARAAASLRHPNIASVYHFGEQTTGCFYAMEFVEGESVGAAVESRGPFPWPVALEITRQTASALAAVHARQLVHRDIKPENLMLTREEGGEEDSRQVKLIDFGLAKDFLAPAGGSAHALTIGFLGTPYYASPEQCEELECDIRSDIYGLGATLWFMLTGRPPFTGNLVQIFNQHLTKPPPFSVLPADVPRVLHSLLARMLAKEPHERPQTPFELRREINACGQASAAATTALAGETFAETPVNPALTAALPNTPGEEDWRAGAPAFPAPLTRFFGREREIAIVCQWLRHGDRLVTLTGSGGAGKTRLSLEVAKRVEASLGWRTFFVALSDLENARFLSRRVRDSVLPAALDNNAERPGGASLLGQIVAALSAQRCLLVLDNFEQLAENGAEFVGALLARVPALSCLVTSRRRLDLSGERELALPSLTVPAESSTQISLERLAEFDSVRLFRDRAQAVRADFELNAYNAPAVAELCRRLEGMPLAIELAAARVEVLTPREIVGRLAESLNVLVGGKHDVAVRHRTLRATLDWSYELLSPPLRLFFARLSVFRGGWTAEAAAALEEGSHPDAILTHLSALRRSSLILAQEHGEMMRYRMLETLRQYAGEQLARLGDEEAVSVRGRHRDFFLALALKAEPELRKSNQAFWLGVLETEHENFRAALARTNDGEPAQLSLAYCLHRFWMIHGHVAEGREWLARALTGHGKPGAPGVVADPLVAKVRNAAGVLAWSAGDLDAAQTHLEESLAIHRALDNLAGAASALNNLGLVASERSDFATARDRYEGSLTYYRQINSPSLAAAVLHNLGEVLLKQGMYSQARHCLEESLALEIASPDQWDRSNILANLAEAEAHDGDLRAAYRRFEECLTIRQELGDTDNFEVLWRMAGVALNNGDKPEAALLLAAADTARVAGFSRPSREVAAQFERDVAVVCAAMEPAQFAAAMDQGRMASLANIIELCRKKRLDPAAVIPQSR